MMNERGLFVWLSEVLSSHPPLPKRIREIGLFFQEEEYLAYSYKSGRKIWLWITASIAALLINSRRHIFYREISLVYRNDRSRRIY